MKKSSSPVCVPKELDPFPRYNYSVSDYAITYKSQKDAEKSLSNVIKLHEARVVGNILEIHSKSPLDRYSLAESLSTKIPRMSIDPILRLPFRASTDKNFSDVTLLIGQRRFPSHRVILASLSDYFNALFTNNVEKDKKEVRLKDIDPKEFEQLLSVIYGGSIIIRGSVGIRLLLLFDYFGLKYIDLDALIPELENPPIEEFEDYLVEMNKLHQGHKEAVESHLEILLEGYYSQDQEEQLKVIWDQLPERVQESNSYMLEPELGPSKLTFQELDT